MASPHLFTHLFHGGVIISTRKLVYDSGAAEDSIKSLMQSQHKAVLRDLRKGTFDDKIDQYLGDAPGLLPRGSNAEEHEDRAADPERASAPVLPPADPALRADTDADPFELSTPPPKPRTQTAERKSSSTKVRSNLPPAVLADDAPTLNEGAAAAIFAAISAANSGVPMPGPSFGPHPTEPAIEIELELDADDDHDDAAPRRAPRDTDVVAVADLTTPMAEPVDARAATLHAPPHSHPRAQSAVGA
ncbi:MAG: hypothetical protein M3680_24225, partial [Myxococcota bacterium]|nr:hypothetical protein [Myxococcota bacterium]